VPLASPPDAAVMMDTVFAMHRRTNRVRLLLALAALLGVLAMHGLSSSHAFTPLGMIASPGQVHACAAETGAPQLGMHAGVAHEHQAEAISTMRQRGATVACASHCSMNHTECVATLRDTTQLKTPSNAGPLVLTQQSSLQRPALATARSPGGRAPPDVSLAMLCTCRT
jgi:hypothetical protein